MELPKGGCSIYLGEQKHKHSAGVLMNKYTSNDLVGFYAVSERVILLRFKGKPIDMCIMQVFSPACDYSDEEVDGFLRRS